MGLLRQQQDAKKVEKLRGGAGKADIFLTEGLGDSGPIILASRLELAAGATIGFHRHYDDEEVYAIISGQGRYTYDGGSCEALPGDIFTTKRGMAHGLENIGNEPLVFFAIVGR